MQGWAEGGVHTISAQWSWQHSSRCARHSTLPWVRAASSLCPMPSAQERCDLVKDGTMVRQSFLDGDRPPLPIHHEASLCLHGAKQRMNVQSRCPYFSWRLWGSLLLRECVFSFAQGHHMAQQLPGHPSGEKWANPSNLSWSPNTCGCPGPKSWHQIVLCL